MKPSFKYAVIHRHRTKYTVKALCEILQISRSGYYKYVKHLNRTAKDFELAIEWLCDAGLIYKVNRCKKGLLPLAA